MIYAPEIIELYPWFADLSGSGSFSITSDPAILRNFRDLKPKRLIHLEGHTASWLLHCVRPLHQRIRSRHLLYIQRWSTLGTLDKYAEARVMAKQKRPPACL